MEFVTLNDGIKIPAIGFGVFMIPADGSTYKAVREALDAAAIFLASDNSAYVNGIMLPVDGGNTCV